MPATDKITIRMTAEDAGAFEEWRKQAKGPEMMGDAIEKAAKHSESHIKDLGKELLSHAGHWIGVAAAIEGAKKMIEGYLEAKREMERGEAQSAQSADTAMRTYFTTQNISGAANQARSTQNIGNIALQRHATLANAGAAANLLSQFGVSREEAEGGTLNELLQLESATSAAGGDPQQAARRVLDFLHRAAPGRKVDAKSIRNVGQAISKLTGQEGFSDATVDVVANVATELQQGGYDYATSLALATVATGKGDPRQAKPLLREWAKPGMQKGEAEALKKALGILGPGSGEADYATRVGIGETGPMATVRESETGGILGELGRQQLTREQITARLKAVMASYNISESRRAYVLDNFNDPVGPNWLYSNESLIASAARQINFGLDTPTGPDGAARWRERGETLQRQISGEAPIPKMIFEHRFTGQDGRSIPAQSRAVGIQAR